MQKLATFVIIIKIFSSVYYEIMNLNKIQKFLVVI